MHVHVNASAWKSPAELDLCLHDPQRNQVSGEAHIDWEVAVELVVIGAVNAEMGLHDPDVDPLAERALSMGMGSSRLKPAPVKQVPWKPHCTLWPRCPHKPFQEPSGRDPRSLNSRNKRPSVTPLQFPRATSSWNPFLSCRFERSCGAPLLQT